MILPLFTRLIFCLPIPLAGEVEFDSQIPQVAFAAQELEDAMNEAGREDLNVALVIHEDESSSEAYQIRPVETAKKNAITNRAMPTNGSIRLGIRNLLLP